MSIFLAVSTVLLALAPFFSPAGAARPDDVQAIGSHLYTLPVDQDGWLKEQVPLDNFGGDQELIARDLSGDSAQPVYRYDLTAIPAGAEVVAATAYFWVTQENGSQVNVHRITTAWTEGSANWQNTAANIDPTPDAAFIPANKDQFVAVDITDLVQDWLLGNAPNYGLLLAPAVSAQESKYASKEWALSNQRPYLKVEVAADTLLLNAMQDTWISKNAPGMNYGGCDAMNLDIAGGGLSDGRMLVQFDLSAIPAGATPVSAELQLTKIGGSDAGKGAVVRQLLTAWGEGGGGCAGATGTASWTERLPGVGWTTAGGDDDPAEAVAISLGPNGVYSWNVIMLVNQWLQGVQANHGFIIGSQYNGTDVYQFASREHSVAALRPRLAVTYVGGAPAIGDIVWDDKDRDGIEEVNEPGIANVAIELYAGQCGDVAGPPLAQTTTAGDGRYQFAGLNVGDYCVLVDESSLPAAYVATTGSRMQEATISGAKFDIDFGYAIAYADDRTTVDAYAPCNDTAWLQTIAANNGAAFIHEDVSACVFALAVDPVDQAALQLDAGNDPHTLEAGPDIYTGGSFTPNDPDYNNPTKVYGPQQINAEAAWDVSTGDPSLIVAVLDTGIDASHPEFAGRVLPGWDFVNDDADPADDHGHGTHVAGIIAAAIDNNIGIAGIAGGVRILPVKVLNENNTGWWSNVAAGISWAVEQGADVINLSLAGSIDSGPLQSAVSNAVSQGVAVVVAAGNNGIDTLYYPASYEEVISLGATTFNADRWTLSNFGPNVDVMAPGATVYSTIPGGGYRFMSGTSMASPHAAGVVALMLSINPDLTPVQIKTVLQETAVDMGVPGPDYTHGYGRIDAAAAVSAVPAGAAQPPTTRAETMLIDDLNGNGVADPGDTLRYTIIAANTGPVPLANVVVSATLGANVSYVAASTALNGVPVRDDTAPATPLSLDEGGLNIGSVPPAGDSLIQFDVVVQAPAAAEYTADMNFTIQTPVGTDTLVMTTPINGALLALAVDKAQAHPLDSLTYTITSAYLGNELLQNLVITAPVPAGTTLLPGSVNAGGAENAGVITWNLGSAGGGAPGFRADVLDDSAPGDLQARAIAATTSLGTNLSAGPTLLTSGDILTVTLALTGTQTTPNVTPSLVVTGANGVGATLIGGPSPAQQTVTPAAPALFTWVYQTTDSGNSGELRWGGNAANGAFTWPWAESNRVVIHPPLTFGAVIAKPAGADPIIANAYIDAGGPLPPAVAAAVTDLSGEIRGVVWNDADGDAILDGGESGLAGAIVRLTDNTNATVTTAADASGNYTFTALNAGTYTISLDETSTPPTLNLLTTPHPLVLVLTNAEEITGANLGLKDLGTVIGDAIWYDADGDGLQDAGEPGIGNVTLDLYLDDGDNTFNSAFDFLVDSAVSEPNGAYRLDAPVAGSYFVDVTDDHGLLAALSHVVKAESIVEPSPPIAVGIGDIYLDADFAYVRVPATGNGILGDIVWADANANQHRELNEPVLLNVQVCATPGSGGGICTTTDLNGRYLLELPADDYVVAPPAASFNMTATTLAARPLTLAAGAQVLNIDFGYFGAGLMGGIGGQIWQDLPVNGSVDGVYDPAAEPGISDVSTHVIQDVNSNGQWDSGEPILAAATEYPGGRYQFDGLLPGNYLVRVSDTRRLLRDFAPTLIPGGPDEVNRAQPYAVALAAGVVDTTADFGYREFEAFGVAPANPGLIGDQLWADMDADGVYDLAAGDLPLPGITLQLHPLAGGPDQRITTGLDGKYRFVDQTLGSYEVTVSDDFGLLADYAPVWGPSPGQNSNSQSRPYTVTLGFASENLTADFGYVPLGTLGGFTYFDNNGDGRQDTSETTGVSNIPITLLETSSGASYNTASVNGVFSVTRLYPGLYQVLAPAQQPGLALTSSSTLLIPLLAGQTAMSAKFGYISPTGVTMTEFAAENNGGAITLRWSTSSEVEVDGFVVWRTLRAHGSYKPVSDLIPAHNGPSGSDYKWLDSTIAATTPAWYKLESRPDGHFFGPLAAIPDPGHGNGSLFLPFVTK